MTKKVLVLMSSYNGEKYISEQILSIVNQRDVNLSILIRDDGSTDNTLTIIESFIEQKYPIVLVKGKNIGVIQSFQELLLSASEADYYALCDQDDIWYADKLEVAIKNLCSKSCNGNASLYYGNQDCIKEKERKIYRRFDESYRQDNIITTLLGNQFSGCTMVFNNAMMNRIKDAYLYTYKDHRKINLMHDTWILAIAQAIGNTIYDPIPHMAFRRHFDNVTDERLYNSLSGYEKLAVWKHKIKVYFISIAKHGSVSYAARVLLDCFGNEISKKDFENLKLLANYRNNPMDYFKVVMHSPIKGLYPAPKIRVFLKFLLRVI